MRRYRLALLLLLPIAFAAGRWSLAEDEAPEAEPKTVRAQAYSIVWADSALELSHGGGRRVHEIFFPDFKVGATVVFEHEYTEEGGPKGITRPRMHVWRAERPRSDLQGIIRGVVPPPAEITVVEVPLALALAVSAFADLADRYRATGRKLGTDLTAALGWKDLGSATWPSPDRKAPPPAR